MTQEAPPPSPLDPRASTPRPREPSPWRGPVIAAVILGIAVVLLLAVVPLPQHSPDSFSISSEGGIACGWGPNLTAAHDGTLGFSWSANDSSNINLYVENSSYYILFTGHGKTGDGIVDVVGGSVYLFNLCSGNLVTVQVSADLAWKAPLL